MATEILSLTISLLKVIKKHADEAKALEGDLDKFSKNIGLIGITVEDYAKRQVNLSAPVQMCLEELNSELRKADELLQLISESSRFSKLLGAKNRRKKIEGSTDSIEGLFQKLKVLMEMSSSVAEFDATRLISDREAQDLWCRNFGKAMYNVPWNRFLEGLQISLKRPNLMTNSNMLRDIMDASGDNEVSPYEFDGFLKVGSTQPKYFHGYMTSKVATDILDGKPVGSFLVRFSQSRIGHFALGFVNGEKKIQHALIYPAVNAPYCFSLTAKATQKMYSTIPQLVMAQSGKLKHPVNRVTEVDEAEKEFNEKLKIEHSKANAAAPARSIAQPVATSASTAYEAFDDDEL